MNEGKRKQVRKRDENGKAVGWRRGREEKRGTKGRKREKGISEM